MTQTLMGYSTHLPNRLCVSSLVAVICMNNYSYNLFVVELSYSRPIQGNSLIFVEQWNTSQCSASLIDIISQY